MASVTALEAKTRFGALLERAANGEEIVITKHDKPVARLVPEGRTNLQSMRTAAKAIHALRERIARRVASEPKLTALDFKSAKEEGRK